MVTTKRSTPNSSFYIKKKKRKQSKTKNNKKGNIKRNSTKRDITERTKKEKERSWYVTINSYRT